MLFVEKGRVQSHDDQISTAIHGLENIRQTNHTDHQKDWVAHSVFGGNSNCWWACTPRLHPADFGIKSRYGIGHDWPLSYADLEPYYTEAENLMQISGGGSDHILPRATAFPFPPPPHTPSRSDLHFRANSANWFAQPTARANGGSRASCCANGVCDRCPVDAKFTISNANLLAARPNCHILLETELRTVAISAGKTSGAMVSSGADSKETFIESNIVALGTNGVFNAATLLRSGVQHPMLGRGLNEQVSLRVDLAGPGLGYFGGTSITGHGYDLYDGAHRRANSAILIEVYNSPAIVQDKFGAWGQATQLKLIAEDLLQDNNRVTLSEDAGLDAQIDWHGHSDYALDGLRWGVKNLPGILPGDVEITNVSGPSSTEAHLMGTHRMGNDAANHVVDDQHKLHGVAGLYVLGSGAFPSTSPANPTLTIAALALRAGRMVSA